MPAFVAIPLNPVTITMLAICSAGVVFMICFLVALIVDERRIRTKYVIYLESKAQQSKKRAGSSETTSHWRMKATSDGRQINRADYSLLREFGERHRF